MIIKDWIVLFIDENKDVVDKMELNDLSYEEAEIMAEDNLPDEAEYFEIKSMDEIDEENESDEDDYFEEEYDEDDD